MSVGLLIFYAIALVIILAGGFFVYWGFRRRGLVLALVLSLLTMAVLTLVWPLPIHGGFMLLGEAVWDEWSRDRAQKEIQKVSQKELDFLAALEDRFQGELLIVESRQLAGGWQQIVDGAGNSGWLSTASGMIWSQWLELPSAEALPALELARQPCMQMAPAGFWALPTEAEHALMWLAGGADVLPATSAGSVSYTVKVDFQMEMPVYQLGGGSNSGVETRNRFSVRCVARGPGSPKRGYIQMDIPLDDWNQYQLSKSL
jgi:hypothetical protein